MGPSDVVAWRSHARHQLVVTQVFARRYMLQALFGCTDPKCVNETCYNYYVAATSPSLPRRPTALSARAIAFFLLSTDQPFAHLCEAPLRPCPANLGLETDEEARLFLQYWLQGPLERTLGVDFGPYSPLPTPEGVVYLYDISTVERGSELLKAPSTTSVPRQCQAVRQFLRQNFNPGRIDISSNTQVVCSTIRAIGFEYFANPPVIPRAIYAGSSPRASRSRPDRPHDQSQAESKEWGLDFRFLSRRNLFRRPTRLKEFLRTQRYHIDLSLATWDYPISWGLVALWRDRALRERQAEIADPKSHCKSLWVCDYQMIYPSYGCINTAHLYNLFSNCDSIIRLLFGPDPVFYPSRIDPYVVIRAMRGLKDALGHFVLDCLLTAIDPIQNPSCEVRTWLEKSSTTAPIAASFGRTYISDNAAGSIVIVAICAIIAFFPPPQEIENISGLVASTLFWDMPLSDIPVARLAKKMMQVLSNRRRFDEIGSVISPGVIHTIPIDKAHNTRTSSTCGVISVLIEWLRVYRLTSRAAIAFGQEGLDVFDARPQDYVVPATITIFHSLALNECPEDPRFSRWSIFGASLDVLKDLNFEQRALIRTLPQAFHNDGISKRLIRLLEPTVRDFCQWEMAYGERHILMYPFLFTTLSERVIFRALNATTMQKAYIDSVIRTGQLSVLSQNRNRLFGQVYPFQESAGRPDPAIAPIRNSLSRLIASYLVLRCSRDRILEDTFDQLANLTSEELLRPIKIRLGTDGGEVGEDHGGVSQEFFSLVFARLFEVERGMFVITDPASNSVYFRAGSLEDLRHFELAGQVFGLAAHNGCVIPFSFPLALYCILLSGKPVSRLDLVTEDWPSLSDGLRALVEYREGDEKPSIADAFYRSYTFSFDSFAGPAEVDMEKFRDRPWDGSTVPSNPQGPDDEPAMVDRTNRYQFVDDYVDWLTYYSVKPQVDAFARGFFAAVGFSRDHLNAMDPYSLKHSIEGISVNIQRLHRIIDYREPYYIAHPVIQMFWMMISRYSPAQLEQLLKFVTSTSRLPLSDELSPVAFTIEWQRWDDPDARLPGASSCAGVLILPEYSSVEVMQTRFETALEHSIGFGLV